MFAPERQERPQDFARTKAVGPMLDAFLPGNEHLTPPEVFAIREPGTAPNTPGWRVRVVPNRFPALRVEEELRREAFGLYEKASGLGAHEVIIETPDPRQELGHQPLENVLNVLRAWRQRIVDLAQDVRFEHILIFKNVGWIAGASVAHPHSQLVALPILPRAVKEKTHNACEYYQRTGESLFAELLRGELAEGVRIVHENDGFLVFCPFASRMPFELCVLPKRQSPDFHVQSDVELALCADALRTGLAKIASAVEDPAYNLALTIGPLRRDASKNGEFIQAGFCWHIEILPRLSGIAGFELGTGFYMNTVFPEEAAATLRAAPVS